MRRYGTLLCALLMLAVGGGCLAQSYAERLGWKAGDRVLLIHADDAGMSLASTLGAIACLKDGVVTSTSVMMPCPWVPMMVDYLKQHPEVDAGLHLALTAEHENYRWGPVAGVSAVPGLANPAGYLWDNNTEVTQHATADEVEREIRAQIDRALALGMKPTHIDTHMGTLVARPDYTERYVKVAIEKGLCMMAFARLESGDIPAAVRPRYEQMLKAVWEAGIPVVDCMIDDPYGATVDQKKDKYKAILQNLKPGINYLLVHCAVPSAEQVYLQGLSAASRWTADWQCMLDPEIKQLIKDQGIILTNWRELKERRQRAG